MSKFALFASAFTAAAIWTSASIAQPAACGSGPAPSACGPQTCQPVPLPQNYCKTYCKWNTIEQEVDACEDGWRTVPIEICRSVPCEGGCGPVSTCRKETINIQVPDCKPVKKKIYKPYCEKITECHEFTPNCQWGPPAPPPWPPRPTHWWPPRAPHPGPVGAPPGVVYN